MQKSRVGAVAGAFVLGVGLVFGLNVILAQSQLESESQDQIPPQLVSPENVPESGTFWFLQSFEGSNAFPPLPFNPFPKLPIYW